MLQSRNETYLPLTSCTSNYPSVDGRTKGFEAPCDRNERTRHWPTNFSVKNADGSMKNYSIEIPAAPAPHQAPRQPVLRRKYPSKPLSWLLLGGPPPSTVPRAQPPPRSTIMTEPIPYYLVHLTGKIGDSTQPLYAAVLEDGRIVRPTESTAAPMKEMKPAHKSKAEKTKKGDNLTPVVNSEVRMIMERVAIVSPKGGSPDAAPSSPMRRRRSRRSYFDNPLALRYLRISRRYLIVSRSGRILLC